MPTLAHDMVEPADLELSRFDKDLQDFLYDSCLTHKTEEFYTQLHVVSMQDLALLTDEELRGVITGQELAYFKEMLTAKKITRIPPKALVGKWLDVEGFGPCQCTAYHKVTNSLLYDSHHMVQPCNNGAAGSSDPNESTAHDSAKPQKVLLRRRKLMRWNGGLRFNVLDGEPTPQIVRESVNNERAFAKSVAYHDQLLQKQLNDAKNAPNGQATGATSSTAPSDDDDPPPPYTPSESTTAAPTGGDAGSDPAAGVASLSLNPAAAAPSSSSPPPVPMPMAPGMPSWGTPSTGGNSAATNNSADNDNSKSGNNDINNSGGAAAVEGSSSGATPAVNSTESREKSFFEQRAQESAKAREAELAKLSPEARVRMLAEEAEAKKHDDAKSRHHLKTTRAYKPVNPLALSTKGGRGGGGRGGGAGKRPSRLTGIGAPAPGTADDAAVAAPPEDAEVVALDTANSAKPPAAGDASGDY